MRITTKTGKVKRSKVNHLKYIKRQIQFIPPPRVLDWIDMCFAPVKRNSFIDVAVENPSYSVMFMPERLDDMIQHIIRKPR